MMQIAEAYRIIHLIGGHYNETSTSFDMTKARIEKAGFKKSYETGSVIVYELVDDGDDDLSAVILFSNQTSTSETTNFIADRAR